MKILIFIPNLSGGGAERVFLKISSEIKKRGQNVELILSNQNGPYISELPPDVPITSLNSKRVLYSLIPLARLIRKKNPDLILSALPHANSVAILAKKLSGKKIKLVISERNTYSQESFQPNLKNIILKYLMRKLYKNADAIITVSDGVRESLINFMRINNKNYFSIPNPCDSKEIKAKANLPINDEWFLSSDVPVVIAVGRLTKQKDFSSLIKSFAIVIKKTKARLLILGEGEERNSLEILAKSLKLSNELFCMPGFKTNPFKYIKASSLFVLSSRWEGFPNVLLQAIACNCKIISTNCQSGPLEILDGGKYGDIIPVGDIEAMANSINRNLNNPRKYDISNRCNHYSIKRTIESYLEVINSV